MNALADIAVEIAWHGWQASVAGAIALGLTAAIGRRSPRAAALLVSLALLKFIVPPFVRVPVAFGDSAAMFLNPLTFVPPASETGGLALPLAVLGAVTIVVSALVAARHIIHARTIAAIRRRAVPAGDRAAVAMTRVASALGLRHVPALLISSEADGPFATGVWSQAVVLPRGLAESLEDGRLEAVLAHELLHHRRRDLPMAWCAAAVTSVFWFSPVAWQLARKLTELRELCCDAGVVRAGIASPREYVETLLTAAAVPAGAGAVAMHDGHPLGRRLRRLLEQPDPLPRGVSALLLVLFALLCLPATPFMRSPAGDARVERIVIRY